MSHARRVQGHAPCLSLAGGSDAATVSMHHDPHCRSGSRVTPTRASDPAQSRATLGSEAPRSLRFSLVIGFCSFNKQRCSDLIGDRFSLQCCCSLLPPLDIGSFCRFICISAFFFLNYIFFIFVRLM